MPELNIRDYYERIKPHLIPGKTAPDGGTYPAFEGHCYGKTITAQTITQFIRKAEDIADSEPENHSVDKAYLTHCFGDRLPGSGRVYSRYNRYDYELQMLEYGEFIG